MKKFILILCFIFVNAWAFAQQTPYQKRISTLKRQFLVDLGYNPSIFDDNNKSAYESLFLASSFLKKIQTERGILRMMQLKRDIKDAEKLKNTVDFQAEANKKQAKEAKQLKERKAQQARQLQQQQAQEAHQAKIALEQKINNADKRAILQETKEYLSVWIRKGEFEKQEMYEKRLSEELKANFSTYCADAIEKRIAKLEIRTNIGTYDTENESFPMTVKIGDTEYYSTLAVGIEQAQAFKETFSNDISLDYTDAKWSFSENYLVPNAINIIKYDRDASGMRKETFSKFVVNISQNETEPLIINSRELQITEIENYNISLDYNAIKGTLAKEKAEKQKIKAEKEQQEKALLERKEQELREKEQQEKQLLERKEQELREKRQANIDLVLNKFEKTKSRATELLNFTEKRTEKKKNNVGKTLLNIAGKNSTTNEKETDLELYDRQLSTYIRTTNDRIQNNFVNRGAKESIYKDEKNITEVEKILADYDLFLGKAFVIAHDRLEYQDFGKVKVSKDFYEKLKNSPQVYDLVMQEEIKKKR